MVELPCIRTQLQLVLLQVDSFLIEEGSGSGSGAGSEPEPEFLLSRAPAHSPTQAAHLNILIRVLRVWC